MDFTRLGTTKPAPKPVDPIKIFESLPSLGGSPNDLWRGQHEALSRWFGVRDTNDILILLNTGAGKTIVGLLIAQSLVNEGVANVIYVCSTTDLVLQTSKEADGIGIPHTIRTGGSFSNDLFEIGKSFCITTYAALFNGHSSIRRKHFPGAVVFDDAHVAEGLLRGAFTLRVDSRDRPDLFGEIAKLFEPHFKELGISARFRDSLDPSRQSTTFVAPGGLYHRTARLLEIFNTHDVRDDDTLKYPFAWLEDNIESCAAIFSRGVFELAPPFLPSLAIDVFERPLRRVYLSATLESQTEFIRAFGRKPKTVIQPSNDAGNGERLIIDGRLIKKGTGPDFVKSLVRDKKAVIAVPDYARSRRWVEVAEPPSTHEFTQALGRFRAARKGAFLLVSRVDGIDLPHDTCRIMVMEGLPSGMSLLERYQWEFLRMKNVHSVRVANRLTQLFGRINRGRNDYGAFLLEGDEINKWLANDRNLALVPPLLQKQVLVGREVQASGQVPDQPALVGLIDAVLDRDQDWLDYYQREVKLGELDQDQLARAEAAEPFLENAALSEMKYAAAMWCRDPATARRELEKTIDRTATYDTPLGGWHALWLGAAYEREGDTDAACREYTLAMNRLGREIALPRPAHKINNQATDLNGFGEALWNLVGYSAAGKFEAEFSRLKSDLAQITEGTPKQAEVGVRVLGEILGFVATRPDNDQGVGPDVLWRDETGKRILGFELKTDKADTAIYSKSDVGQGHNHLRWIETDFDAYKSLGLLFVGPATGTSGNASPSDLMGMCVLEAMAKLRDEVLALIEDLRRKTPLERLVAVKTETERDRWYIENVLARLWHCDLADAKK